MKLMHCNNTLKLAEVERWNSCSDTNTTAPAGSHTVWGIVTTITTVKTSPYWRYRFRCGRRYGFESGRSTRTGTHLIRNGIRVGMRGYKSE